MSLLESAIGKDYTHVVRSFFKKKSKPWMRILKSKIKSAELINKKLKNGFLLRSKQELEFLRFPRVS